jgi:selenide, water dikinase
LLGHALKLAQASEVSIKIDSQQVPSLNKAFELIEMGCIPGAAFRNLEFVEDECLFEKSVEYNSKMLLVDAQTSGGLLICSPPVAVETMKKELIGKGYEQTAIIGEVIEKDDKSVYIS